MRIFIDQETGKDYVPDDKTVELIIHQISQPKEVAGGSFDYDTATRILRIKVDLSKSTQHNINIKL